VRPPGGCPLNMLYMKTIENKKATLNINISKISTKVSDLKYLPH